MRGTLGVLCLFLIILLVFVLFPKQKTIEGYTDFKTDNRIRYYNARLTTDQNTRVGFYMDMTQIIDDKVAVKTGLNFKEIYGSDLNRDINYDPLRYDFKSDIFLRTLKEAGERKKDFLENSIWRAKSFRDRGSSKNDVKSSNFYQLWWWDRGLPRWYDPESSTLTYFYRQGGEGYGELPDEYLDALLVKWKNYETYRPENFYFDWDTSELMYYDLNEEKIKTLTKENLEKGQSIQPESDSVIDTAQAGGNLLMQGATTTQAGTDAAARAQRAVTNNLPQGSGYYINMVDRKVPFLKLKNKIFKPPTVPTSPIGILLSVYLESIMFVMDNMLSDMYPNLKACNPGEYDLSSLPEWAVSLISAVPVIGEIFGRVLQTVRPYLCIGRSCPADREMDRAGGLCYPRCRDGYTSNDITMCIRNGNALDFYDRGVGTPAIYFRFKERNISTYQAQNQLNQQLTNDLKAIRYAPNYGSGSCILDISDQATMMKAARLFIELTNRTQWIVSVSKAVVSSSRSYDVEATLNNGSKRVIRFYFTKDVTGCSFTPKGFTILNSGTTTWDFEIYGGKDVNITLDYGISDSCRANNVGDTCSSPLVLTESISGISKALPSGQWLTSVNEVKDINASECNYKITVDTFDPPTNRPMGKLNKIVKSRLTRIFNPATCDVKSGSVQDLGAEALITDASIKTGYSVLRSSPAIAARPPPAEKTLAGCTAKCSDAAIISKVIADYNRKSGPNSKIIRVKKASTPTDSACDFLMDMVIRDSQGNTKTIETARRIELSKVGNTCEFDFKTLGDSDSAFYIQDNSPEQTNKIGFASSYTNFMGTVNKGLNDFMGSIYSTDTWDPDRLNRKLIATEPKIKNTILYTSPRYIENPVVGTNKQCIDPDIITLLNEGIQRQMDTNKWANLTDKGVIRAIAGTADIRTTYDFTLNKAVNVSNTHKVCFTQYEYKRPGQNNAALGTYALAFRKKADGKLEAYVVDVLGTSMVQSDVAIDSSFPTVQEIRDMQAKRIELENKAVADAAADLLARQTTGGFKTVQGCGFTPQSKQVKDIAEKFLRDRVDSTANKTWDSYTLTLNKWGYDDATNTVFYNSTINFVFWFGPHSSTGTNAYVFTKGLCSPLVLESATPVDASKAPNNFT